MFDNETNDYALDDCAWWDTLPTRRPWWARNDCAGRVGDTETGVMCEEHHNAWLHVPVFAQPSTLNR